MKPDIGYQEVTCADCARPYICQPLDDYYEFTSTTDGVCFRCLLRRHNLEDLEACVVTTLEVGAELWLWEDERA